MHDSVGLVLRYGFIKPSSIDNIAALERPPFDSPLVTADQIVIGHRQIAGERQRLAGMGADVTCTSRYQDCASRHPINSSLVDAQSWLQKTIVFERKRIKLWQAHPHLLPTPHSSTSDGATNCPPTVLDPLAHISEFHR